MGESAVTDEGLIDVEENQMSLNPIFIELYHIRDSTELVNELI